MFNNADFAFNNLLHNGHIGSVIIFDCIIFRVCTYLIHRIIEQISLTWTDFSNSPICSAYEIVCCKRAVTVGCILSNRVITFEQTIYCTAKFSVTLCVTFFIVLFCYGYSELFEYIGKLNGCSLSTDNSNRFCILRNIFDIRIFRNLIITGCKIGNVYFTIGISCYIFRNTVTADMELNIIYLSVFADFHQLSITQ